LAGLYFAGLTFTTDSALLVPLPSFLSLPEESGGCDKYLPSRAQVREAWAGGGWWEAVRPGVSTLTQEGPVRPSLGKAGP
jgi:hypothetical protein